MSKKIVITGGLGYIGTELCRLYSGEARFHKIIVVDNKFHSYRVKQLRDWGIEFIQASILETALMEEILHDADIVFHLAGITDVAYIKTQQNSEKDNEIRTVGIDGTRQIIGSIKSNCRLIFPSTHVVYEGFQETKTNIHELETPCPVLTYATGKYQSENDLLDRCINAVILRLASVYGYSEDATRINIMPNLFSKIASQNGTISLFSGGVQLKSLVNVIDVCRCMKFMAETNHRGIFHVSNENMTVKQVAEICKEMNPKVELFETNDEIPNLGYTISNSKLLDTGFKFLYNLKDSIKQMITNWSVTPQTDDLEYILKGGKEFIDSRGKILNYELTEPINLIGYIESARGAVRANHYHPVQEQKCLLVSGQYISVTKDLLNENSPIETKVINAGDVAVIKPNVAHAMVFTKDSVFLNLVRGEREHENYGITHTIPHTLVDEKFKNVFLENYLSECRVCQNNQLEKVISLGLSPLANNLTDEPSDERKYLLQVDYCPSCHNCQLNYIVPPKQMFDNYLYTSSTTSSFRKHFEEVAEKYIKDFNLTQDSLVVDIGSNDGIFLKPLKDRGIQVFGIEPAKNIAQIAIDNGIQTRSIYFHEIFGHGFVRDVGRPDLVTASNVFAHSDEIEAMTKKAFEILKQDGRMIIEVQYLLDTIKDLTFDNIYHEHVNYWSVTSLKKFFDNLGFVLSKVERINTHGGSIRVYVTRDYLDKTVVDQSVYNFINEEKARGLHDYSTYVEFRNKIEKIKANVEKNITSLKKKYPIIAGYGAPAKATTSLNYFCIKNTDIQYIIEDNKLKHGKYVPGVNIPIISKKSIERYPDLIIVLAWNFYDEVVKNNKDLIDRGVKFINIKSLYGAGLNDQ